MIYVNTLKITNDNLVKENKDKYGVIWDTVLQKELDINQSIAVLLRSYTRAINNQENRTGSLFQMKTKSSCLTDNSELSPAWFQTNFGTLINIEDT